MASCRAESEIFSRGVKRAGNAAREAALARCKGSLPEAAAGAHGVDGESREKWEGARMEHVKAGNAGIEAVEGSPRVVDKAAGERAGCGGNGSGEGKGEMAEYGGEWGEEGERGEAEEELRVAAEAGLLLGEAMRMVERHQEVVSRACSAVGPEADLPEVRTCLSVWALEPFWEDGVVEKLSELATRLKAG